MAYKQKGFPQHHTGPQSKHNSPVKMSDESEATLIGVGTGAASGAAAGAVLGPWGAAAGAVIGGAIGGVTANKNYKANKELKEQQAAIDAEIKAQEDAAKEKDLAARFASEKARSYGGKLPGRIERINPDGTVTHSTEVAGTPANLGKLYAPLKNPVSKKGKLSQGEKITRFNSNSMNVANEPTGTNVSINKRK